MHQIEMDLSSDHLRMLQVIAPKLKTELLKLEGNNEAATVALEQLSLTFDRIESGRPIKAQEHVPSWHLCLREEYKGFGLTGEPKVVTLYSTFHALSKGHDLTPELVARVDT